MSQIYFILELFYMFQTVFLSIIKQILLLLASKQ